MSGLQVGFPTENQLRAGQRALRYLNATRNLKLLLKQGADDQLCVHTDTNWGGKTGKSRRSWSGILIMYGTALICTISCLQKSPTLSFTEAEYMTLSEATKTVMWVLAFIGRKWCETSTDESFSR